jgi:hypothetical protein
MVNRLGQDFVATSLRSVATREPQLCRFRKLKSPAGYKEF